MRCKRFHSIVNFPSFKNLQSFNLFLFFLLNNLIFLSLHIFRNIHTYLIILLPFHVIRFVYDFLCSWKYIFFFCADIFETDLCMIFSICLSSISKYYYLSIKLFVQIFLFLLKFITDYFSVRFIAFRYASGFIIHYSFFIHFSNLFSFIHGLHTLQVRYVRCCHRRHRRNMSA